MIFFIILIYICIYLILYFINNYLNLYEKFTNDFDSIKFKFHDSMGFYSNLFFVMNNYIYCKKNNLYFNIDDSKWLYKKEKGWEDYFLNININNNKPNSNIKITNHGTILEEYEIYEYKNILNEFYKYNNNTITEINNIKNKLNLTYKDYDSIYIRRGDKLSEESKYIETKEYFDFLININPQCKKIYLQTDDYNSFLDLQKLVIGKNIDIYTLCDPDSFGSFTNNYFKDEFINNTNNKNNINNEYMSKINNKISSTKPISDMNLDEKYKHTLELIMGIDILINSNICILDYQSNVSRFVKLSHNDMNNVYDIITKSNVIDLNKKICPAYSF
jgi:hypothetical protein